MPAHLKDPALRRRRNKASTRATLDDGPRPARRHLPKRRPDGETWHSATREFWNEVWSSPMAGEFLAADVPGLVVLATLVDAFHCGNLSLAAEIQMQLQAFGLTPLSRRRLEWRMPPDAGATRRALRPATPNAAPRPDPRELLFGKPLTGKPS